MKVIEPQVFLIGETRILEPNLQAYLDSIGAGDWTTDAGSDSEKLTEVAGRACYRSWKPGLNPNVTKVREGNQQYLANIIDTEHGSVMEHSVTNWVFKDVSRVLTHELVRHRVGVGISQESLRYVRLTDLSFYLPGCIADNEEAKQEFFETFSYLEGKQKRLADIFGIENMTSAKEFPLKKMLTSAFRRIAPIGLATSIVWSTNFRTMRFVVRQRTHRSAEEEIRKVFGEVYRICKLRYPNLFQDFQEEMVDGLLEVSSPHAKA